MAERILRGAVGCVGMAERVLTRGLSGQRMAYGIFRGAVGRIGMEQSILPGGVRDQ